MSLETKICQEVDTWQIKTGRVFDRGRYQRRVKPILYGIAIDTTRELVDIINTNKDKFCNYLNMPFNDAVEKFITDLRVQTYLLNDCNSKQTGDILWPESNENSRKAMVRRDFSKRKISMKDMKKNPQNYELADETLNKEIVQIGTEHIKRYANLLKHLTFQKAIENQAEEFSKKLLKIASNEVFGELELNQYLGKPYKTAVSEFKKNYLLEQLRKNNFKSKLAAEASGISPIFFRVKMNRAGLYVADACEE